MLEPDEVTYSVLVRGYGSLQEPRWAAIASCLGQMETDHGETKNTQTHARRLVARLGAAGGVAGFSPSGAPAARLNFKQPNLSRPDRPITLNADMPISFRFTQPPGLKPTHIVYNALLESCARSNDVFRGEEIITRMESEGVVPNEQTFDAVKNKKNLRSLLRRKFGDARDYKTPNYK